MNANQPAHSAVLAPVIAIAVFFGGVLAAGAVLFVLWNHGLIKWIVAAAVMTGDFIAAIVVYRSMSRQAEAARTPRTAVDA